MGWLLESVQDESKTTKTDGHCQGSRSGACRLNGCRHGWPCFGGHVCSFWAGLGWLQSGLDRYVQRGTRASDSPRNCHRRAPWSTRVSVLEAGPDSPCSRQGPSVLQLRGRVLGLAGQSSRVFDILELFVRLQLQYHWMQRMTHELFLKAQARHVLQSFLNHQKEPAYSQCFHICVNWPQQTGATSCVRKKRDV